MALCKEDNCDGYSETVMRLRGEKAPCVHRVTEAAAKEGDAFIDGIRYRDGQPNLDQVGFPMDEFYDEDGELI